MVQGFGCSRLKSVLQFPYQSGQEYVVNWKVDGSDSSSAMNSLDSFGQLPASVGIIIPTYLTERAKLTGNRLVPLK